MRLRQLLPILVFVSCTAAAQIAPSKQDNRALTKLDAVLTQLESRLQKAEALRDIKRLQYSYAHYAESGLWLDLGDLFAANGVAHYAQGDYKGPESLRKFYLQELGRGQMGLAEGRIYPHIMIQPVVTVAQDGKTAKGRWHVIAMLGSFGTSASWAGVVYENKYVLENSVWKINELSYASQYNGRYTPPSLTVPKWELPLHFTAQSAGNPAPDSASSSTAAAAAAPTFEELQRRWYELARRARQLRDETDVLNLQHNYGYAFDQKKWAAAANLFARNGTLEWGERGGYVGRDRIRRALNLIGGERQRGDEVHDHLQLATVVHIGYDGGTAKARGVQLSLSGVKGSRAEWEEGIFENTYVKQSGVWKIRSVHYYPRVITDYELGWAKDAKPAPRPSVVFPPDWNPQGDYGVYPKMYYPRFHYPNPVTHLPVQYPPGITSTTSAESWLELYPGPYIPKNVQEFATRLYELEQQIEASVAYDAVENLISAHGYDLDDASAIHQTVQPVVQIAADGQSATIRARLLKVDGKAGELAGGTYEGRATNRSGVWKLESLALKPAWSSPFTQWKPVLWKNSSVSKSPNSP